jgi:hypothetical protein
VTRDLYLITSGQMPIIVRGIGKDDPNGAVIQGDMLDSIVGRQLPPRGVTPAFGADPAAIQAGCWARHRARCR